MMPYWPFQQYETERAKIHAARRGASSRGREIAAAQSPLSGHLTGTARAMRHLFMAGKQRPQCGGAQIAGPSAT
jgi:hypothetical protein